MPELLERGRRARPRRETRNAMNHARRNELSGLDAGAAAAAPVRLRRPNDTPADRTSGVSPGFGSTRRGRSGLGAVGRALANALFPWLHLVVRAAVRVCFGRLETVGRERLPRRGPVLVVTNHPAAWTDVAVLEVALPRKLHFVAHQPLFRPWIRGLLLELFATLPVWRREEEPESVARNQGTFARCHALFRRGEVVVVFPEGVSGGDRGLLPLKTGTARMLLDRAGDGAGSPLVLPIAIHYDDRTVFRTRVVIAVGPPIAFEMRRAGVGDADAATRALTDDIARAITASLATAAAHAAAAGRREGPAGLARRALEALATAGAAIGRALHAAPLWAIERAARRFAREPQQVAFARMVAGLVMVPLWYALLAGLAATLGGGAWFLLPASAPPLGALACRDHDRRVRPSRPLATSRGNRP